jgi:hypothetical protein
MPAAGDVGARDEPLIAAGNRRILSFYRGVEQPVAHRAHNPEVVGSNPTPATPRLTLR